MRDVKDVKGNEQSIAHIIVLLEQIEENTRK